MMDTLHSGSSERELISIKSEDCKIALTIKGKASHPNSEIQCKKLLSSVKIESNHSNFDVQILDSNYKISGKGILFIEVSPIFYEQRNYEVCIEYDAEDNVVFDHDNMNIRNKITETGKLHPSLSGIINFRNEIGYSDLRIIVNEKEYLKVKIEVFPSKLDYQNDYKILLDDVTKEVYNLAFDFLKKTYNQMGVLQKSGNSLSEFFSIISFIFHKMLRATDTVIAHAHHELQSYTEIVTAHKVKKVDSSTLKWMNKHPQFAVKNNAGQISFEKVQSTKKQVSFDTFENRFIKFVLLSTMGRLEKLKQTYCKMTKGGREKDEKLVGEFENMYRNLRRRTDFSFLKNVGQLSSAQSMSLVFAMAPGYKELYRYYIMLKKGLSLHGSIFNMSMKDTASLYEYWCFIKLNSMLKNKYRLVRQDILKTDKSGLFVTLKKGKTSSVEYINPLNGEKISLAYNKGFKSNSDIPTGIPTLSQYPDNVLNLSKKENGSEYEYIFDAKYRINMADPDSHYYKHVDKNPGPEEDTINTMHRYRDAIVYQNNKDDFYKRKMFGAYVLFPYNDEDKYKSHRFYKSIDTVNVGGLPFLPGATKMVEKFLNELIIDSATSAFERATLPKGIEEKLEHIDLSVRDVLVGMMRNKEQLTVNIKEKFYHIPASKIAKNNYPIRYVALHQTKNIFQEEAGITYYGEVRSIRKVKRSEITEIAVSNRKNENEDYYYFEIVKWKKLEHKINIDGRQRTEHYYTNYHLMKCSKTTPELFINSLEELRLYTELKRISDDVRIMEDNEIVRGFEFNGSYISVNTEGINVQAYDGKQKSYSMSYFAKKSRQVFKEIRDAVDCK